MSLYSDEELDECLYQLKLEKALSEGDTAEADKLRRRHGVTLEQLVDRFLNLDLSSLPTTVNGPWPHVLEDGCTYSMSRTNYKHIAMDIKNGRAKSQKDDMWRWIDFIESSNLTNLTVIRAY